MKHLTFALASLSLAGSALAQTTAMRVASYNLEWFGEGATAERIANINSVLSNLKPNVIGLMEVQSKAAVAQLFPAGGDWQVGIQDDPTEPQELAIAVRKPFKLVEWELVFTRPLFNPMFPNRRDVIRAIVEAPNGRQVPVYVLHLKSRSGGRMQTDLQREAAAGMLASFLYGLSGTEKDYIVMGDFNDSPDDRSVNILESGDLMCPAGAGTPQKVCINLAQDLYAKDYVTHGLERVFKGEDMTPIVTGASASNDNVRGKDYKFPDDVPVTQILFDQILVSPKLAKEVPGKMQIYAKADSIRGKGPRVKVTDQPDGTRLVEWLEKGTQASDHQPVYADFALGVPRPPTK
ncbi:MAG: endonuclease/exonuclease/phosphatase family protein [Chthonomonas sp.]|nr:endonuclease/exonuclease/phosphatase family protein [Chthonomonas sp.]